MLKKSLVIVSAIFACNGMENFSPKDPEKDPAKTNTFRDFLVEGDSKKADAYLTVMAPFDIKKRKLNDQVLTIKNSNLTLEEKREALNQLDKQVEQIDEEQNTVKEELKKRLESGIVSLEGLKDLFPQEAINTGLSKPHVFKEPHSSSKKEASPIITKKLPEIPKKKKSILMPALGIAVALPLGYVAVNYLYTLYKGKTSSTQNTVI